MKRSSQLQGRIAVVTGSTRGIGLIIAKSLASAGANVVICSRSGAILKTISQQVARETNTQVLGVTCDVSELEQVEALAHRTMERFGKIDIWFNNAAVNRYFGPILEAPVSHWQEVINTNLNGTYYGTMTALKHMLPLNQGKIINLLGAGGSDSPGNSYLAAYTASKAAVRRFTLVVATDYRDTGLSILGMNPGLMATELTTGIKPLNDEAVRRLKILEFGLNWFSSSPEGVARTAVHMASDVTNGKTGKIYRCRPGLPRIWRSHSSDQSP
jgi:NAD(P)-dependent dehydrogenase (short-subunit alcohol dehydrogenase family)